MKTQNRVTTAFLCSGFMIAAFYGCLIMMAGLMQYNDDIWHRLMMMGLGALVYFGSSAITLVCAEGHKEDAS